MRDKKIDADDRPQTVDSVYSADGVDLTLIRWMLSLSPKERLKVLENNVNSILKLRHAKAKR